MDENPKQSWYELCELAAKEEDPEKLLKLVQEINRLLEKKITHLSRTTTLQRPHNAPASPLATCFASTTHASILAEVGRTLYGKVLDIDCYQRLCFGKCPVRASSAYDDFTGRRR